MTKLTVKTKKGTMEILVEKRKIPSRTLTQGVWVPPRNREVESGVWGREVHDARLNSWRKVGMR